MWVKQDIINQRDEGFHKLQQAIDSANLVVPNTSSEGKDNIAEQLQSLRQGWDDMCVQMHTGKSTLEAGISQRELHDDVITQLLHWMTDMEKSVKAEESLQSTLPEKRAKQERIKVSTIYINPCRARPVYRKFQAHFRSIEISLNLIK